MRRTLESNRIYIGVSNGSRGASFNSNTRELTIDVDYYRDPNRSAADQQHQYCAHNVQGMGVPDTLLHEVAHAFQTYNPRMVDGFLAQGFSTKYPAYASDPQVQAEIRALRILRALGTLGEEAPDPENADGPPIIRLTPAAAEIYSRLWARYREHGMAIRNENDFHAADIDLDNLETGLAAYDEGKEEYWAMVVQMYMWSPEKFCKTLNPREQQWFKDNMKDCLQQYPTPPCLQDRNALQTPGTVGGEFLRR